MTVSLLFRRVAKRTVSTVLPLLAAVGASAAVDISKLPSAASRLVDFAKDIQPIFAKNCYSCHGPEKQKAGLRWDDRAAVLKGSENGPVLIAGKSAEKIGRAHV